MGVLSENAIIGASAAGDYYIDNSCRFDDGGGSKLTRTPSSAGNLKTWTLSFWMKQAISTTASSQFVIFDGGGVSSSETPFGIVDQCIEFNYWNSGTSSQSFKLKTNQVFRDQSAWYHIVCAYDSPQATAANRLKLYVNGSQVTSFSTANYPAQNLDATVNAAYEHYIGTGKQAQDWSGYLADFNLIDGLALTPASFAETDVLTNEWKAKKYGGAYGTNGFFLEFKSSGALGTDTSGNGHNWTSTNLAATDQMIDTPQNSTGGNFCTMNPLAKPVSSITFSEGNLKVFGDANWNLTNGTVPMVTGKWYWELLAGGASIQFGILADYSIMNTSAWKGMMYYPNYKVIDSVWTTPFGTGFGAGDIIGCAVDMDSSPKTITWYKNNTLVDSLDFTGGVTSAYSVVPGGAFHTAANTGIFNFGQDSSFAGSETAQNNADGNGNGDFYYAPPTGFLALCTNNLPDPSIALPTDHFNTILWTGDGTSPRSFTGVGFTPDLSWTKNRTTGVSHMLYDIIRGTGATKTLESNAITIEGGGNASTYGYLSAFGSDGFTTTDGSGSPNYYFNENEKNFVSWNWKAGGTAVSNTDGSITSSVSANPTAGFSVVGYTSINTTVDETIGHGLSVAPEMVIVKNLDLAWNWDVWTPALSSGYDLRLNDTAAQTASRWSTTAPTASVVTLKYNYEHNSTNEYIAYCFHSVEGYSKVGSYIGNSSTDGTFVYCGFKPAYIMQKNIGTSVDNWNIWDVKRDTYNVAEDRLYADTTSVSVSGYTDLDIISNGFKFRRSSGAFNATGNTSIYIAFAESPFKYSRAR